MNLVEFRKQYMKTHTAMMRDIGFEKGKSSLPTYWHFPCDDKRLTWVICFDLSVRANPLYNILIGPYWENFRLESADPFPRNVSYHGTLGTEGFNAGVSTRRSNIESFEQSIKDIQRLGLPYLAQFSTPEHLYRKRPHAILAYDLGKYDDALKLFEVDLIRLYGRDYTASVESKAGQKMHIEDRERCEAYVVSILEALGASITGVFDAWKIKAAHETKIDISKRLEHDPNSRWLKRILKDCDKTLEQL